MTPQPKKKLSRIRQGLRRATQTITLPKLVKCVECGSLGLPHTVCNNCGKYKSRVYKSNKVETKVKRVS